MRLHAALFLALSALPLAAVADKPVATVKQGAPACMTGDLLDQLLGAILNNDQAAGVALLKKGCIILKHDTPVTVLDTVGDKIYVEADDPKLDMWIPAKYLEY